MSEIKEILKTIKECIEKKDDSLETLMIPLEQWKSLLDYITNLQEEKENQAHTIKTLLEENERLKEIVENLTTMTVCGDRKQIKNTAQYKLDIYKSRNEKAIEYFKYQLEQLDFYEDTKAKMLCAMGIVILQGEDKDE